MKIEAGKYYRNRRGSVVGPMRVEANRFHPTFTFKFENTVYNAQGSYGDGGMCERDLVEEIATRVSDVHALRRAIGGDREALNPAFCWSDSPQGHRYWHDRYYGGGSLSAEDVTFLRSLLPAEPAKLTLQVGKHYKLRNGMVVGPLEYNNHRFGIRDYPFKAGQKLHELLASSWTETGQFHRHGRMPELDIVAEFIIPAPVYTHAIQPGKRYKTRAGRITSVMKLYGPDTKIQHCDAGYYKWSGKWNGTDDFEAHDNDIVSEYVEPKQMGVRATSETSARANFYHGGDRIALFLSEAEAETLYRVLGRVSGDARTTRRGHTDAIRKALGKAGVQHDGKDDIRNVINFCNK